MMASNPEQPRAAFLGAGGRFLLLLACLVVVVAGLRAAESILVPFMVALFIAILSLPIVFFLKSRGVANWLAVVVAILVDVAVLAGASVLVGNSVNQLTDALPEYRVRFADLVDTWLPETATDADLAAGYRTGADGTVQDSIPIPDGPAPTTAESLFAWLASHGISLPDPRAWTAEQLRSDAVFDLAQSSLRGLAAVLSNVFLVVLIAIFILAEASTLPEKFRLAFGRREAMTRYNKMTREIQRYLVLKTLISAITGVLVGAWCAILGVDFAMFWGLLAFLFNYVPNIGSILAAVPACSIALIQYGPGRALALGAGYLAVNIVLGNFIEPAVMGRRLGMSTLVVVLSLVFWGWLWGPAGMFLSVPLTMIVKIMLENSEDMKSVAVLLGPAPDTRLPIRPALRRSAGATAVTEPAASEET